MPPQQRKNYARLYCIAPKVCWATAILFPWAGIHAIQAGRALSFAKDFVLVVQRKSFGTPVTSSCDNGSLSKMHSFETIGKCEKNIFFGAGSELLGFR